MGANKEKASGKTDYATPQNLVDEWSKDFNFNIDCCASAENAKCSAYINEEMDAFKTPWGAGNTKGRVFCNPPYGRGINKWIERAIEQVKEGVAEFVFMLLPANTDTKWFHDLCKAYGRIKFLRGRITFVGETAPMKNGSMIVLIGSDPSNWKWDTIPSSDSIYNLYVR